MNANVAPQPRTGMKAISVRQPWAWLIVHGKDIENRKWRTHYRGPVLIHAAKGMSYDEYQMTKLYAAQRGITVPDRHRIERGGIVGMTEIVDCVTKSDSRWFMGPMGFVLANTKPLPFIECSGALGLFDVPEDIARQVLACG
jgi:hypothetical protein